VTHRTLPNRAPALSYGDREPFALGHNVANTTFVSACGKLPSGVTSCSITMPGVGSIGLTKFTFAGFVTLASTVASPIQAKMNDARRVS